MTLSVLYDLKDIQNGKFPWDTSKEVVLENYVSICKKQEPNKFKPYSIPTQRETDFATFMVAKSRPAKLIRTEQSQKLFPYRLSPNPGHISANRSLLLRLDYLFVHSQPLPMKVKLRTATNRLLLPDSRLTSCQPHAIWLVGNTYQKQLCHTGKDQLPLPQRRKRYSPTELISPR